MKSKISSVIIGSVRDFAKNHVAGSSRNHPCIDRLEAHSSLSRVQSLPLPMSSLLSPFR